MATHVQKLLRQKIYDTLSADATLIALVSLIYSNAPDNSAYPRIKIGDQPLDDWGSHTHDGFQGEVLIHAWTQGESDVECINIMNRVYTVLHNIDLGISGYSTVNFRCASNTILLEPDGRTYQGIQRYSVMLG